SSQTPYPCRSFAPDNCWKRFCRHSAPCTSFLPDILPAERHWNRRLHSRCSPQTALQPRSRGPLRSVSSCSSSILLFEVSQVPDRFRSRGLSPSPRPHVVYYTHTPPIPRVSKLLPPSGYSRFVQIDARGIRWNIRQHA